MRHILVWSITFIALWTIHCNKKEPAKQQKSLLELVSLVHHAEEEFFQFARTNGGNPYQALVQTKEWALQQPTVQAALIQDSCCLRMRLKSGLLTCFRFDLIDENGLSIYRGGTAGKAVLSTAGGSCSKPMENKKVLIYAPAFSQFYKKSTDLDDLVKTITDAGSEYEVVLLKDENANLDIIQTFGNYGLVIINTHGQQDGFLLGYKLKMKPPPGSEEAVRAYIASKAGQRVVDLLESSDIGYTSTTRISFGIPNWYEKPIDDEQHLWVTTKYLNSLPKWSNTIIFGNMCLSGADQVNNPEFFTQPLIRSTMLNRNPVSYYCYGNDKDDYSNTVTDRLCKEMEDSLVKALVVDGDSTGIAHLKKDFTEYNDYFSKRLKLKQYNSIHHCYGSCGSVLLDKRDGQTYQTVCINKKVWMAENLNYAAPGSACYDYNDSNCNVYGRLYTWDMIMNGQNSSASNPSGVRGICPEGWHIPSEAEWQNLVFFLGGDGIAGGALKSKTGWQNPNTGADNSSGFSALPGGRAAWSFTGFVRKGYEASYWTSSQAGSGSDDQAGQRTIFYNTENVNRVSRSKKEGLCLRCVKD